ncbi:MAG TPA: trypsin-like peptidase domain-containing protein [Thermodesulfovibrionia bacterium]|nr:trypsin-like peptidase domain-containing protein [Thermodesulfovibrionia bacterium]
MNSAVFQITSLDTAKSAHDFGTGFLIYQDKDSAWFVTCRHVVETVGGWQKALVGNMEVVDVRMLDKQSPYDLAVLKVSRCSHEAGDASEEKSQAGDRHKVSPLKLARYAAPGTAVLIDGFSVFDQKEKSYRRQEISARLVKLDKVSVRGSAEQVNVWDLDFTGSLQRGYSGSPVIDTKTCDVVGVISNREGEQKGVAVCIEALDRVWHDMPSELKDLPRDEQNLHDGDIKAKTCDRDKQIDDFRSLIPEKCPDSECRLLKDFKKLFPEKCTEKCHNLPRFYFIHGDLGECPFSLIERIQKTFLQEYILEKYKSTKLVQDFEVQLPLTEKNYDRYQQRLQKLMSKEIAPALTDKEHFLNELCSKLEIHKAVVIKHHIHASKWHSSVTKLIKRYLAEYWAALPENAPGFHIFFAVEYQKAVSGFKLFNLNWWRKLWVKDQIKHICKSVRAKSLCVVLEEIKPVDTADVSDWLRHYYQDVERYDKLKVIFGDMERLPMAKVEGALQDIINQIDRKLFHGGGAG